MYLAHKLTWSSHEEVSKDLNLEVELSEGDSDIVLRGQTLFSHRVLIDWRL